MLITSTSCWVGGVSRSLSGPLHPLRLIPGTTQALEDCVLWLTQVMPRLQLCQAPPSPRQAREPQRAWNHLQEKALCLPHFTPAGVARAENYKVPAPPSCLPPLPPQLSSPSHASPLPQPCQPCLCSPGSPPSPGPSIHFRPAPHPSWMASRPAHAAGTFLHTSPVTTLCCRHALLHPPPSFLSLLIALNKP